MLPGANREIACFINLNKLLFDTRFDQGCYQELTEIACFINLHKLLLTLGSTKDNTSS